MVNAGARIYTGGIMFDHQFRRVGIDFDGRGWTGRVGAGSAADDTTVGQAQAVNSGLVLK